MSSHLDWRLFLKIYDDAGQMAATNTDFLHGEHLKVLRQLFERDSGGEILVSGAYQLYKEQASTNHVKPLDINKFGLLVKHMFPEPIVQKKRKVFEKGCPRASYYTGNTCRVVVPGPTHSNSTKQSRKPLSDRTKTFSDVNNLPAAGTVPDLGSLIDCASFGAMWNLYSKSCWDFDSWKLASLGFPFRLCQYSSATIDRFPVVKVVEISPDLSFSVRVANTTCILANLGWSISPLLTDYNSLTILLNIVSGSKICLGVSSESYESLPKELKGNDMKVCGVGRLVKAPTTHSGGKLSFFSVECLGLLSYLSTDRVCSRCHALDSLLRKKVSRIRLSATNLARSANWKHLDEDMRRERIADLQRRKANSDKRAEYAARYLKEERKAKLMTLRDHNDLKIMLQDIETQTKGDENSIFEENPGMKV